LRGVARLRFTFLRKRGPSEHHLSGTGPEAGTYARSAQIELTAPEQPR
jgi:hypothetical protein